MLVCQPLPSRHARSGSVRAHGRHPSQRTRKTRMETRSRSNAYGHLSTFLRAGFSFEKASFWGFFGFDAPPKPIFLRFWHRRVGLGSRMVSFSGKFLRCLQLAKAKGRRSVCSNEGSLEQTFVSGTSALTTRGPSTSAPVSAPGRWHWPRLLALPQCINDASYQ